MPRPPLFHVGVALLLSASPLGAQITLRPSEEFAPLPELHSYVIGLEFSQQRMFLHTVQESYSSVRPYNSQIGWQKEFDVTPYNVNLFENSNVQIHPENDEHYYYTGGLSVNRSIIFQQSPISVLSNARIGDPGQFGFLPNGFLLRAQTVPNGTTNVFFSANGQEGNPLGLYRHDDAGTPWTALPQNTFGTSGPGQVTSGVGALKFGPDGLLNVIDTGAQRIFRYDPDTLAYVSEVTLGQTNLDNNTFVITPNGFIFTTFTDSAGGAIYNYATGAFVGFYGIYSTSDIAPGKGFGGKTSMTVIPETGAVYLLTANSAGEGLFVYDSNRLLDPTYLDPLRLTVSHDDLVLISPNYPFTRSAHAFTIDGANHYPNGISFEAGTLILGSAGALGSEGTISFSGGTMKLSAANTTDYSARFSTDAGQQYSVDTSGQNVTLATTLTSDGGSFTKKGPGVLTLTSANTFTGGVTLNGGTLHLGSIDAIGHSGPISFTGGVLQFSAVNTTDYSARFSTASDQQFSLDTNGQNVTLASPLISEGGSLTKSGAGTLTLTNANTYTGSTTISGGTLNVASGNDRLPAGTHFSLNHNSTLELGGTTQTIGHLSTVGNSAVGNITAGTLVSTGEHFLQSGTYDATFTGTGPNARLAIGGDANATVMLNGSNDRVNTTDHRQVIIGDHYTTGDAGVVRLGSPNALAAATEIVEIHRGTLDLNGQANVRAQSIYFRDTDKGSVINEHTAAKASFNQTIYIGFAAVGQFGGAGDLALGGAIHDEENFELEIGIKKFGAGTLTLSGASTYRGTTTVSAGTLIVNGSIATSRLTTVQSSARLGGSGTVGALTLEAGATLAPGNSPGTLTAGNTTWNGGANYVWEINNAASPATGAGTRYDLLSISGTLTLAATAENKFTLTLASLLADNSAGDVLNFNRAVDSSYTIASATGGIIGFDANAFTIDSTGLTNASAGGIWSLALANSNRDLQLNFTAAAAIPEPSTYAALAGAVALALAAWRRRP